MRTKFAVTSVGSNTSVVRDLGFDSVRLMSFMMLLENEAKIDIFGRGLDLARTHTVGGLARFIEECSDAV